MINTEKYTCEKGWTMDPQLSWLQIQNSYIWERLNKKKKSGKVDRIRKSKQNRR